MQREINDFVRYCKVERRLAAQTCIAYEHNVRACARHLEAEGIVGWSDVRAPNLRGFLAAEVEHRPAASSQSQLIASLKGFFRFCVENEYIDRDPARVLRTPKKNEALPDVLDRHELARLLAAPARDGSWQRHHAGKVERDTLMLALLACTGLRRSELLALDWDDIDFDRRLIRVRRAKGGRQRMVPMHPALEPLFMAYLRTRLPLVERALFVGIQGRRMSITMLSELFRHYTHVSGVAVRKRVTPHTLRHVRLRAAGRWRQPAPDPRATRAQAPRLHPALHTDHRAPTPRRD